MTICHPRTETYEYKTERDSLLTDIHRILLTHCPLDELRKIHHGLVQKMNEMEQRHANPN